MAEEKTYENKVKKFLEEQGAWFIKYWGGAAFTKAGIPDILCCYQGHFLGIEIKAFKGKPSPLQIHNLKKIDEAGGFAILLYPQDFVVFKDLMQCIKENDAGVGKGLYLELKERWESYGT